MANIPPEVWFHVAKFVPKKDLRDLLEVNSIFFDIAMDIRYREILITTRDISHTLKFLRRLGDTFTASRVNRFSLELTHFKGFATTLDISPTKSGSHIRRQLQHTMFKGSTGKESPTFADFINEIINITDKLVNVRELYIDWHIPHSYDPQPLFSSFWLSFGPNLYTLSFSGNLKGYRTLIKSNPTFDRLQELRVEFIQNSLDEHADADEAILVDDLLPFINNLAPRLVSLRWWSWAPIDFSAFFSQVAPFPVLDDLNIRTSFNQAFRDASGLKGLICDSSGTLQRVDLRLNRYGLLAVNPLSEEPLGRWLLECMSDERFFSRLQVLAIYPTDLAIGMEFLLGCIQRTSDSLMELIVRDRYLHACEVRLVLGAASSCSNLKFLRMNIWRLDVALMDYLALKLSTIDRLWLSIGGNIVNVDPNDSIDTLIQDLGTRSYTNWKLKDIAIWQNGQELDSNIMSAVTRSIPSLMGHTTNP